MPDCDLQVPICGTVLRLLYYLRAYCFVVIHLQQLYYRLMQCSVRYEDADIMERGTTYKKLKRFRFCCATDSFTVCIVHVSVPPRYTVTASGFCIQQLRSQTETACHRQASASATSQATDTDPIYTFTIKQDIDTGILVLLLFFTRKWVEKTGHATLRLPVSRRIRSQISCPCSSPPPSVIQLFPSSLPLARAVAILELSHRLLSTTATAPGSVSRSMDACGS